MNVVELQREMSTQENEQSIDGGEKSKKYDRQLRLWGDHGQAALEKARVCLINATATGTEILKNIILPGVGSFTIVDGGCITEEDLGNNFFFDKDSIGKPRAQVATELLRELNDDVNGDYLEENTHDLLDNNSSFFTHFSIVVATSLSDKTLLKLAALLWEHDIPLLVCSSYGFIGYMRLITKEHTVVESHPDNTHEDLRLDQPFHGLKQFCDEFSLETMNKKDHSHTPWLIIIYKYLQKWKDEHDGQLPKNYREKNQLKDIIRTGIRCNEEGVPELEENFDEAVRNVNTAVMQTKIPSDIQAIFDDELCKNLDQDSKSFWILARALKEFVQNCPYGLLPLRGSIPDMTSDSERYIQLQQVYREQAATDIITVTQHVHQLLEVMGKEELMNRESRSQPSSPQKPQDGITENDIKTFCKNAWYLRVVRCRPLMDEYSPTPERMSQLSMRLEDEDDDVVHYLMLRAVQKFYAEYNRYPGSDTDSVETDIPKLKVSLNKLLSEMGISVPIKDEYSYEYCRYGAAELHSVAAYMGGAAAQEVIKLITHQFVPINNTYIYNAMKQSSTTMEL